MKTDNGLNALQQAGMQIVQNRGVQNSVQNLGKSILQGGVAIGGATGAAAVGTGSLAGISTAVAGAGSAISGAATAVGSAIVTAAASPIVIGCAIVGTGILIGAGIKKLFE